jgi:hypothetical protein
MIDQEIERLECKVLDLEYQRLEKMAAPIRARLKQPKPLVSAPAPKRTTPAGTFTICARRAGEKVEYSVRSATGAVTVLPEDRSLWPEDVRRVHELCEKVDAQRRRLGGHLIGTCGEAPRLV